MGDRALRLVPLVVLFAAGTALAAEQPASGEGRTVIRGAELVGKPMPAISLDVDLRDLPPPPEWQPGDPIREVPRRSYPPDGPTPAPSRFPDDPLLARQPDPPEPNTRDFDIPILNFDAQNFSGVNPPDTVGDVGPNHYLHAINNSSSSSVRVYDKSGNVLATFLMASLGAPSPCNSGFGDPIVLWDGLADRWLLAEFAGSGSNICIYVSKTPDPVSGGWWFYRLTTASFPDYPKFAVWPDAYYMTSNEGNSPPAYALDRTNMLTGAVARAAQRFAATPGLVFGFEALTPADLDGATPPPAGAPGIFMRHRDDEATTPATADDFLDLWEFHVDFNTPANSTFSQLPSIAISEFSSELCGFQSFNCFPQPGSGTTLDPLREVIMWRLQYRNFGSHQALVGNFVTDADGEGGGDPLERGGVRWFELRKTSGNWGLTQEGTHSPDVNPRWMGAIAMDGDGDIAVGYNISSSTVFPALRYAGRLAADAAGTLRAEVPLVAGAAANGSNRYGDYAAMSVDPADDCTFWFTGMYNPASQWRTRVGVFKFDACGATGTLTGTVTDSATTSPIVGATIQAGAFFGTTNGSGVYSMSVAAATYSVSASAVGYIPETVSGVVVSDGGITTQDFALDPCPTTTVDPATIPAGTAGTAYSVTFTQTGGVAPSTWFVTGALPAGLGLTTSTGELSGTPTQIGSFPFTVIATDTNGCQASRAYTLVINAAGPFVATALAVNTAGNSVFEPGETVTVAPSWRNDTGAPQAVTGAASAFTGPGSAGLYTITDAAANYGTLAAGATASCTSTSNCYGLALGTPTARPIQHWDASVLETLSGGETKTWTLHVGNSFTDVPTSNGFYRFVETLLHKGVTGGCGADTYCPASSTTREQMAVFVLVSKEGAGYVPAACVAPNVFTDVPETSPYCRYIEELSTRGVVGGCGTNLYCPTDPVTREQMAIFVLRTLDPTLTPPACSAPNLFTDVPETSPFCRWIEELANRGVVTGCGGGAYCPTSSVTREQMAVFLAATFSLALYGI